MVKLAAQAEELQLFTQEYMVKAASEKQKVRCALSFFASDLQMHRVERSAPGRMLASRSFLPKRQAGATLGVSFLGVAYCPK